MTQEQLTAFIAMAKDSSSLKEQLKEAADANAVVAIAEGAGFSISADEIPNAQPEISGDELQAAAGGRPIPWGTAVTVCFWRLTLTL